MLNDFLFHLKENLGSAFGAEFDTILFYELSILPVLIASIVCRLAMLFFLDEACGYPVIWITIAFLLCALFSALAISSAWVDPRIGNISVQSAICCILLCCAFALVIPAAKFLLALRTIEAGAFLLLICFTVFLANVGVRYAHDRNYDKILGKAFVQMLIDLKNAHTFETSPENKP